MSTTILAGHRGYSAVYPENTMAAFINAYNTGCNGIEFDVRTSSDGVLCIMHDPTVDRTTDGTGYVHELTWAALSALDAGNGEKIPSLEQILDYFKGKSIYLIVEIEYNENYPNIALQAAEMIEKKGMSHQVLFNSFNPIATVQGKFRNPYMSAGIIVSTGSIATSINTAVAAGLQFLSVDSTKIDASVVSDVHNAGLKLFAWTPDTVEAMQAMVDLGVDGIISNYCDREMTIKTTNSLTLDVPTRNEFAARNVNVFINGKFKPTITRVFSHGIFKEKSVKY